MKIAIIDDLTADRITAKNCIEEYFLKSGLNQAPEIIEFSSAESFMKIFQPGTFQIILLDIWMNKLSGMEAAHQIYAQDKNVCILFLTASNDFISEGYAVRAVRYITKPLFKYKKQLWEGLDFCLEKLDVNNSITVTVNQNETSIPFEAIIYIECVRRKVYFHLKNNIILTIQENITKCRQDILQNKHFLECYRGIIINCRQVKDLINDDFIMKNEAKIPIAQRKKNLIKAQFTDYFINNGGLQK